jgi:hypothetical protein
VPHAQRASFALDTGDILRFSTHMLLSGLALFASASVISVVAELTARGIVGPNGGAGIRIASVMRSEAAWQVGHRAARRWLHSGAAALAGSGVLDIVAPSRVADTYLPIGMALAVCFLIVGAVVAHRAARLVEANRDDD